MIAGFNEKRSRVPINCLGKQQIEPLFDLNNVETKQLTLRSLSFAALPTTLDTDSLKY
jgi:hypothetical protein